MNAIMLQRTRRGLQAFAELLDVTDAMSGATVMQLVRDTKPTTAFLYQFVVLTSEAREVLGNVTSPDEIRRDRRLEVTKWSGLWLVRKKDLSGEEDKCPSSMEVSEEPLLCGATALVEMR